MQVPGKALEKPSDCVPHTFVPGANPSKQAAARQFDQAFTKLHKDKYDISVVWQYGTFFGTNNSSQVSTQSRENCPQPFLGLGYYSTDSYELNNLKESLRH